MAAESLDNLREKSRFRVLAERRFLLRSIFGPHWREDLGVMDTYQGIARLQELLVKRTNWIPPMIVKRFVVLERAVKKFDENTFGVCDGCKENIGKERLLANPSAAYCLKCQSEVETAELSFVELARDSLYASTRGCSLCVKDIVNT